MAPPPATPASSSKFLLSKRPPIGSQLHITPGQTTDTPRQFNATPRFSVSSTPRAPSSQAVQFSTPAILPSRGPSARGRATQDLIDVESSLDLSDAESPSGEERHDALERGDDLTTSISLSSGDEDQGGPSPKRRRITASPALESTPPHGVHSHASPERPGIDIFHPYESSDAPADEASSSQGDTVSEADGGNRRESPVRPASPHRFLFQAELQAEKQAHQTFKPPPPFKQPSADTSRERQYPLPDAFSPQRRGAKYVNGGLAGELRDWLVGVKGASDQPDVIAFAGSKAAMLEESATQGRVVIEEVRCGSGFWLARGRNNEGDCFRVVLAGEGRLSGLAERRNLVASGCNVVILPPMWDIELDGHRWKVVCDWYVTG